LFLIIILWNVLSCFSVEASGSFSCSGWVNKPCSQWRVSRTQHNAIHSTSLQPTCAL